MDARGMRPSAVELHSNYKKRFDIQVSDTDIIYIGQATTGTADATEEWQIKKITLSSGVPTTIEWANGNQNFTSAWSNRGSLSYS